MPLTGLACPTCDKQGVTSNLLSIPGKGFFCEKNQSEHEWRDMEALVAEHPRQISKPKMPAKPPTEQADLVLHLNPKLVEALRVRFNGKLDGSAVALLGIMLDPEAFVVVGEDAKRLQQHLGQKIIHADSLVGAVYSLKADRDEWKGKAEQKVSAGETSAAAPNEVDGDFVQLSLRLTTDQFSLIFDKAKFNGIPPAKYLQNVINMAIENGWF